ncbi:MAG: HD-GYP domain-containing protein [Coriobacteriia bacterium]
MKTKLYVAALVTIAAASLLLIPWPRVAAGAWPGVILLAVLSLVAESTASRLPVTGSVSLALAFVLAALMYGGPMGALAVALTGSILELREHKEVIRLVFNAAQLTVTVLSGAAVYLALGGEMLAGASPSVAAGSIVPALLAALAMQAANFFMVVLVVALSSDMPILAVWRSQQASTFAGGFFVALLLGIVLSQVIVTAGIPGALLLAAPFLLARRTFRAYLELREAYADTVRSLVTTIEAKDPYTKGHSERVAKYATMIAEHLGWSHEDARRLEYAALLHDVGKLAVPTTTLMKPGTLDEAEYAGVRAHPEVGAHIVRSVESLGDVAALVSGHHERPDGAGYPLGLRGQEIPIGSRVLAVADAFDAMTSHRAYRDALPFREACEELRRCAGTQFDPLVVEALVTRLSADGAER